MDLHEPVEVVSMSDPFQAGVIKDALETEGIRCFLDGFNQAALPGINAVPVRILVEAADAERARELIARHDGRTTEHTPFTDGIESLDPDA